MSAKARAPAPDPGPRTRRAHPCSRGVELGRGRGAPRGQPQSRTGTEHRSLLFHKSQRGGRQPRPVGPAGGIWRGVQTLSVIVTGVGGRY